MNNFVSFLTSDTYSSFYKQVITPAEDSMYYFTWRSFKFSASMKYDLYSYAHSLLVNHSSGEYKYVGKAELGILVENLSLVEQLSIQETVREEESQATKAFPNEWSWYDEDYYACYDEPVVKQLTESSLFEKGAI